MDLGAGVLTSEVALTPGRVVPTIEEVVLTPGEVVLAAAAAAPHHNKTRSRDPKEAKK